MKSRLIDVHGIHLVDYEPYFSQMNEVNRAELLSCSIKEGLDEAKEFYAKNNGKIGVMPFASHFNINYNLDDPLYYENQQVTRLMRHLGNNYPQIQKIVFPYFSIVPKGNSKKILEKFRDAVQVPYGVKFQGRPLERKISEFEEDPIMDYLNQQQAVFLSHCGVDGYSNPLDLLALSRKHPGITFIGAHLGAINPKFLAEIQSQNNLYVDCSIMSDIYSQISQSKPPFSFLTRYAGCSEFSQFIEKLFNDFELEDKLLFGTDYPWSKMFNTSREAEYNLINDSKISQEVKEKIFYRNAEQIKIFKG